MALAIDASTPAIAVQTSGTTAALTTASFTPPAGSTLLVLYSANSIDPTSPATPTITDSLASHLTYTLSDFSVRSDTPAADGQCAIWTAPVATSAAMTITITNQAASGGRHAAISVVVLTGAASTPAGAHGKGGSISAASLSPSFTGTAASSWGFIAVADWSAKGAMTAGTGCTLIGSANVGAPDYTYGFVRRTTADGTNGGSTALNVTLGGTSTSVRYAYVEIVPSAGSASPNAEATSGTGAASSATATVASNAEVTSALGTASDAQASIAPNAETTSGAGTAFDATVSTSAAASAPAELATATGTAFDATVTVAPAAEAATATGTAFDATASAGVLAGFASVSASALDALASLAATAALASATGAATDGSGALGAPAELTSGAGLAFDPPFNSAEAVARSSPLVNAAAVSSPEVAEAGTSSPLVSARAASSAAVSAPARSAPTTTARAASSPDVS